jgi:hypothetical protein
MCEILKKIWGFRNRKLEILKCVIKHVLWDEAQKDQDSEKDGITHCIALLTMVATGFSAAVAVTYDTGDDRTWVGYCVIAFMVAIMLCCAAICLPSSNPKRRYFNRSTRVCAKWLGLLAVVGAGYGIFVLFGAALGQSKSDFIMVTPEYVKQSSKEGSGQNTVTVSLTYCFHAEIRKKRPGAVAVQAFLTPSLAENWGIQTVQLWIDDGTKDGCDIIQSDQSNGNASPKGKSLSAGFAFWEDDSAFDHGNEECMVTIVLRSEDLVEKTELTPEMRQGQYCSARLLHNASGAARAARNG